MRKLKEQILHLRLSGNSYNKIAEILNCSKSVISYHCGIGQKQKNSQRRKRNRLKIDAKITKKVQRFSQLITYSMFPNQSLCTKEKIRKKIKIFSSDITMKKVTYIKPSFSVQDLLDKIGNQPRCYLSGEIIDIENTRSWQLDHIIPRTRGGSNDLENANICSANVNRAKGNMTNEEFINMCKKILDYQLHQN